MAVAEKEEYKDDVQMPKQRIEQTVEISNIDACKKHVIVSIPENVIEEMFQEKFKELRQDSPISLDGFRPGKAPKKLIEKRLRPQLAPEVMQILLTGSLHQIVEDNNLQLLKSPDLDVDKLKLPASGPFEYDFEVMVSPEFELPSYKGLQLKRLVYEPTPKDHELEKRRLLLKFAKSKPKAGPDAKVEKLNQVEFEIQIEENGQTSILPITTLVEDQLAIANMVVVDFANKVVDAKIGESRALDLIPLDMDTLQLAMDKKQTLNFKVKGIEEVDFPELNKLILDHYNIDTVDLFEEYVDKMLKGRIELKQVSFYRDQITKLLSENLEIDITSELMEDQAKQMLNRKILQMRELGYDYDSIEQMIMNYSKMGTAWIERELREQFVFQRIAQIEKIEPTERDLDAEIEIIAKRSNESPRKIRNQMEQEGRLDALGSILLDRLVIDFLTKEGQIQEISIDKNLTIDALGV